MDEEFDGPEDTGATEDVLPQDNETQDDQQSQDEAPLSVDDLAAQMGWTPPDKWRGDPAKHKSAAEFLKSTVDFNKSLKTKVDHLSDSLTRMERTSIQMAERAAEQARQEALAEHEQAVLDNDTAAALKAAQKLQQLDTKIVPEPPAESQDFFTRHASWWNKDEEATRVALALADDYAKRGYSPARQIAAVEREMAKDFPEYFSAADEKPRAKAPILATPGNRATAPRAKGFDSLPPEAKSAALESEKRGWGSKEEYAKIYFEEQA